MFVSYKLSNKDPFVEWSKLVKKRGRFANTSGCLFFFPKVHFCIQLSASEVNISMIIEVNLFAKIDAIILEGNFTVIFQM